MPLPDSWLALLQGEHDSDAASEAYELLGDAEWKVSVLTLHTACLPNFYTETTCLVLHDMHSCELAACERLCTAWALCLCLDNPAVTCQSVQVASAKDSFKPDDANIQVLRQVQTHSHMTAPLLRLHV